MEMGTFGYRDYINHTHRILEIFVKKSDNCSLHEGRNKEIVVKESDNNTVCCERNTFLPDGVYPEGSKW